MTETIKRTYAISDIHGEYLLLDRAIDWILSDWHAADLMETPCRLVLLGDHVDRGPRSRSVLNYIQSFVANPGKLQTIALCGNHDQMMVDAYRGRGNDMVFWFNHGGEETYNNYWVDGSPDEKAYHRSKLQQHLDFIESLPLYFEDERRIFVHAGLASTNEGPIPLEKQSADALIWGRHTDPLINVPGHWSKLIVHGHTPVREPVLTDHTLNIDTGACFKNGGLTVARFLDHERGTDTTFHRFEEESSSKTPRPELAA